MNEQTKDRLQRLFLTIDKAISDASDIIYTKDLLEWAEVQTSDNPDVTESDLHLAESILEHHDRFCI